MDHVLSARLRSLQEDVRQGRITLVLGAGVSRSRNVPTWQTLTERMWQRFRSEDSLPWVLGAEDQKLLESVRKELKESADPQRRLLADRINLSAAAAANSLGFQMAFEVLRDRLNARRGPNSDEFAEALREMLYADVTPPRGEGDPPDTLSALASIIQQEQASNSPRILRVITFNVDDLLEYEVHQGIEHWRATPVLWPIARPSNHIRSDGGHQSRPPIPCYHLHGFLPREAVWHEDAPESLVFTDAQYWATVASPLSFANKIMSHALHDSHCVFVGLSMTDINLIRWLGTSSNEICDDKQRLFARKSLPDESFASSLKTLLEAGTTTDQTVTNVLAYLSKLERNHESDVRKSQEKALTRHVWIRTKSADTLLTEFLRLRGVQSLELNSWSQLSDVLSACFPPPTKPKRPRKGTKGE